MLEWMSGLTKRRTGVGVTSERDLDGFPGSGMAYTKSKGLKEPNLFLGGTGYGFL